MSSLSYLPQTEAMLSTSTDIYLVVPIVKTISAVDIMIPLTAAIGTVDKLTRDNRQIRNRRYGIGKNAFEPLDILPGQVTSAIILDKIVLYKSTYSIPGASQLEALGLSSSDIENITSSLETNGELQGLFGITGGNTLYQQEPVHIQVINYDNSNVGSDTILTADRGVTSITYYWNCWFEENPITYSVQDAGNVLVTQSVRLSVGRIQTYEPNLSRILSTAMTSILPSSISF